MKMNMPTKLPTYNDIAAALQRARDGIKEAAVMVVQICDADPQALYKCSKATSIPYNVLANLEKVGRGQMHIELLFDTSPASKAVALLPPAQQAKCYDAPIQVAVRREGKTYVEEKKAQQLTPAEVRVVFDVVDHRVRPVEEQMKVVTDTTIKPRACQPAQRYIITGDSITILAATTFTAVQIEDVLAKLKANALQSLAKKK